MDWLEAPRNERLTKEMRENASVLMHCLKYSQRCFKQIPINDIKKRALDRIEKAGLSPEYFEIVDRETLLPLENISRPGAVTLVAAWAGNVRLIDNALLIQ